MTMKYLVAAEKPSLAGEASATTSTEIHRFQGAMVSATSIWGNYIEEADCIARTK
jgi:hypothetical protein